MEALLDYLKTASIPFCERHNVSDQPVQSITLGIVNKRQKGYGISAATTLDQFRLSKLLVGLTEDSAIAGCAPERYTSICLNVDFGSGLHIDSYNSFDSWIFSLGEHLGGDLFVEKAPVTEQEQSCSIEHGGSHVAGASVNIKQRWYRFDGSKRHCTLPYEGFRVSVVFFCAPPDKCSPIDLARLHHLGFTVPCVLPFGAQYAWPYQICICSTRRSHTIAYDTLPTLLSDKSVPPAEITLCLSDEEDAELYRHLGIHMRVSAEKGGLPEQRRICTRYAPNGSWSLYLDDDLTHIHKPEHLNTHELLMLAFLTAQQRHVHLWGLNTSCDARNLRGNVSEKAGLICGYFFGIITNSDIRDATKTSDLVGGAAEDVERSLRYYVHSGLVRLNFATACAKTKCNAGGLQHYYHSNEHRQAAHNYVLHSLAVEFPNLIAIDPASPNGCKFKRTMKSPECTNEPASEVEAVSDNEDETVDGSDDSQDDKNPPTKMLPRCAPQKRTCSICDKAYGRSADLRHHMNTAHNSEPIETFECLACSRPFRKKKDMLVHIRMQRCHSRRGRQHSTSVADVTEKPSSDDV